MAAPQKLGPEQQKDIVSRYTTGEAILSLSQEFGVSAGTIRNTVVRQGGSLRPVGRPRKATA